LPGSDIRASEVAACVDEAQTDWRIEAVVRLPDIHRSLLAQGAQWDAVEDHEHDVIEKLIGLGIQPRRADPKTVIWRVCHNVLMGRLRHETASRLLIHPDDMKSLMGPFLVPRPASTEAKRGRSVAA
jgi:hypothetical protein